MLVIQTDMNEESLDFGFKRNLFDLPCHQQLQGSEPHTSFYGLDDQGVCQMELHLRFTDNQILRSPLRAPFAGVNGNLSLPTHVIKSFITDCLDQALIPPVTRVEMIQTPNYPEQRREKIHINLKEAGMEPQRVDPHWVIDLSHNRFADSIVDPDVARRIKNLKNTGFHFTSLPIQMAKRVYEFLETCMEERNYDMSLTKESFLSHCKKFPKQIKLFGVFQEEELVAASVSMQVNEEVVYDYRHGHLLKYNQVSPVVLLIEGMFSTLKSQGFLWLDLGSSSLNNQRNESLIRFKENLGAFPVIKYYWSYPPTNA